MEPWRRNFHAVWPSLFATSMGLMAFLPVIADYVRERFAITDAQQLAFWAGIIYGIAPLTAAIIGPVWGALGDRLGKKPMAIRANLAIAVSTALMPFMPSPLWLLLLRAVQGAFAGYVAPAISLVSHDTPPELQGRMIAWLQVAMASGSLLGPLLGACISWLFGLPALFWVTSVLSALAALQLWVKAHEAAVPAPPPGLSFLRELRSASGQLLKNRVFATLLLLVVVLRLGQNMMEPFVTLFARELGTPAWIHRWVHEPELGQRLTTGTAFAVLAVAQWVFTPMWGRLADRFGPLRCLSALGLMLGGVLAATGLVTDIDQFLLARALAACCMAGSMTLAYAAASKRVVAARRTLAFSLVQSCMQFGFGLGPSLGAWIAVIAAAPDAINLRAPFLAAGVLCAAAGAGMLLLRRLPAGRDEHAAPTLGEKEL
ncbi:MAG TPA: MFS transporter [Planctomycetota bacterium]|nr:MFS transporter [Planctomycetota bacterium]